MIQHRLREEILIMDGAMGTSIQKYGLSEGDFRGERFRNHSVHLAGNNDILNLTRPEIIQSIHRSYIEAGADIISTNTFNSNAVSQGEYLCPELVYELNVEGARLAKEATKTYPGRKIWVAGSMGPTSKTLSLSPDVNHPEYRDMYSEYAPLPASNMTTGDYCGSLAGLSLRHIILYNHLRLWAGETGATQRTGAYLTNEDFERIQGSEAALLAALVATIEKEQRFYETADPSHIDNRYLFEHPNRIKCGKYTESEVTASA